MEPTFQVDGVERRFGRNTVLSGVDLVGYPNEIIGLLGPNGGGKSTLLLLLAGLIRPSSGTVQVAGVPAHEIAVRNTGAVGLLTAEPGLYPLLTGWENLEFFGAVLGVSRADVRAKAGVWLEKLGLAGDMNRRTGTWSSGMRQKLSLVRARLMAPRLLLLDEPTANLDPVSAATLWALVRAEAQAGLCVVLVTHDLISAEHLCHRVVFLERTLRHVEEMPGPRAAPESGRLLSLYRQVVGER